LENTSNPITIEFLYYNRWANLRLIDTCLVLTGDQLDAPIPGAYGSIYKTLVHLIRSEAGYLRLLTGSRPAPPFSWDERPSVTEMRPYAEQVSNALIEAAGLMTSQRQIEDEDEGKIYHFTGVTVLIQIINHGVEHRTNITTRLAQIGVESPSIDGWGYMESNPDRMGW